MIEAKGSGLYGSSTLGVALPSVITDFSGEACIA